jgi:hypothetical protein
MSNDKIEKAGSGDRKLALTADFGTVYQIVRNGQCMSAVKADMTLYEKLGHFYKMKDRSIITSLGYVHLNKVASISILTPQTVIVDGRPVPNPHIERDPKTKAILSVNIRKMGIGYSPAGSIVVIDKTLFYNVYTYLIQSVQKKMGDCKWDNSGGRGVKTNERKYPDCAVYGVAGKEPTIKGSWYFLPTEGALGIWINYEDQATVDCLEEHTQRQRFGDRIAQKIVERNILKDHPAIGATQVFVTGTEGNQKANVTVYGFRNENNPRDISAVMDAAEKGIEGFEGKKVEVKSAVIEEAAAIEEEEAAKAEVAVDEERLESNGKFGNPAEDTEPPEGFWTDQEQEESKPEAATKAPAKRGGK